MNRESTWKTEEWLSSAKNLVRWASTTEPEDKVFLLVRHSHRAEIEDHTKQLSTELTTLGCEMSTEFGKHLPADRSNRIFFSFVSRCYQTAEEIAKGLAQNDGQVEEFDTIAILATPEIKDQSVWHELQPDGRNITDFINQWADGDFGDKIEPFTMYAERLKRDLVERLAVDKGRAMHIHITHDLALMAAKRIFLKRPISWEDREPFLGGLGYQISNVNHSLFIAGTNIEYDLER